MTYTLIPNIWYTITPETDCELATPNGISIHLPAGIQYFHFADCVSIDISGTATVTQNPPLFKPASASALGGGYIESNLNVGHGASAAVAAQCTLTPGADLDIGGTLEHDGSVVELEDQFAELDIAVSHPEYGGKLEVTDNNGQTLYTFDIPAAPGDFASIVLTLAQGWELESIEFALDKGDGDTLELAYSWEGDFVLADFADFLNSGAEGSLGDFAEAQTWGPGIKITLKDPVFAGTAGNAVSYASRTMSPFENEDGETFSGGGENARDLAGLVEAMQDNDAPVEVEENSGNDGVLLTSKVGGAAGAYNAANVADSGGLWLGVDDSLAIASPRTPADLAGVIEEDLTLMQLASASVSEGRIVLTAPTTPTATEYNGLEYTATGCFGSGTVKQGSTTRGKNAVAQTDYEIILNGNQPRPLTPTTAMRNGGVYTINDNFDAQLVTIPANASARIWAYKDTGALNVQWPSWTWLTPDGMQPEFDYFKQYRLQVERDNFATTAKVVDSYPIHPEYEHTELTATNMKNTSLELYIVPGETVHTGSAQVSGSVDNYGAFSADKYAGFAPAGSLKDLDGADIENPLLPGEYANYGKGNSYDRPRLTFCTSRPVSVYAVTLKAASGTTGSCVVVQAEVDGEWVLLGGKTGLGTSLKDIVIIPSAPVSASKFMVQFGHNAWASSKLGNIRIFEV